LQYFLQTLILLITYLVGLITDMLDWESTILRGLQMARLRTIEL